MKKLLTLLIATALIFSACKPAGQGETPTAEENAKKAQSGPVAISDFPIVGKWKLVKMSVEGMDPELLKEQNKNEMWMELNADAGFVAEGGPYGTNTGKWFWNANTNQLFFDSDKGEQEDSLWKASFKKDNMILAGIEGNPNANVKLEMSKVEQ